MCLLRVLGVFIRRSLTVGGGPPSRPHGHGTQKRRARATAPPSRYRFGCRLRAIPPYSPVIGPGLLLADSPGTLSALPILCPAITRLLCPAVTRLRATSPQPPVLWPGVSGRRKPPDRRA